MAESVTDSRAPSLRCGRRGGLKLAGRQRFANAVGDGFEFDPRPGHVTEDLVGGRLLALRPELADQRAGILAREPCVAELLAQERPQLGFERPGAQILRRVEA